MRKRYGGEKGSQLYFYGSGNVLTVEKKETETERGRERKRKLEDGKKRRKSKE